ncbi:MAG: hypothetical protein KGZ34_06465 [Nitrosarchaeum sp.]|nr:hypothetical protein [Nitrosarchaeum sp.]
MTKRITIMLDDDVCKKIRHIQAKMIQQTRESYSFSKAINDVLKEKL